ncbi:MAG: hypothetical protein AVDCRST_MAG90-1189, partial [uncultured Microvirga sp.]
EDDGARQHGTPRGADAYRPHGGPAAGAGAAAPGGAGPGRDDRPRPRGLRDRLEADAALRKSDWGRL